MDFTAPHIGFVIASYVVTAVVMVGLAAGILLTDRARARDLNSRKKSDAPHDH